MGESHSSYPMSVRWTGGKAALASAPGVRPDLEVGSPPEFGGPPGRWSPEHFYVGAATLCWVTTFLAVAELSRLEVAAVEADGEAFVERGDDRRYSIPRIVLRPRVTVRREEDRDKALRLIEKAEAACLISRSMRTEVTLEPTVAVEAATSS